MVRTPPEEGWTPPEKNIWTPPEKILRTRLLTPIITYNSALLLSLDSNHLRRAELYVIIAVSVSIRKHLQCSYGEEACACASLALSRFHVSLHIRYERREQLKDVAN